MATYTDLRNLFNDSDLRNRISVAVVIEAYNLITAASPTAADRAWAQEVANNPDDVADKVLMFVLAANESATVAGITGSTDTQIQTAVHTVVPQLVDAFAGV